jgi:hypothetical protein
MQVAANLASIASAASITATDLLLEILELLIIAIPIATISWTVTHEEVFRELREWCSDKSKNGRQVYERKLFYLFTCEYCFSHYVTIAFLAITRFKLLFDDWRGYLLSLFALVWVANLYMSAFGRLRLDIKRERVEISAKEQIKEEIKSSAPRADESRGASGPQFRKRDAA